MIINKEKKEEKQIVIIDLEANNTWLVTQEENKPKNFCIQLLGPWKSNQLNWKLDLTWVTLEKSLTLKNLQGWSSTAQIVPTMVIILSSARVVMELSAFSNETDPNVDIPSRLTWAAITTGTSVTALMVGAKFFEWFLVDYLKTSISRNIAGVFGAGLTVAAAKFLLGLLELLYKYHTTPEKVNFREEFSRLLKECPGAFVGGVDFFALGATTIDIEVWIYPFLSAVLPANPFTILVASVLARLIKAATAASTAYLATSSVDSGMEIIDTAINTDCSRKQKQITTLSIQEEQPEEESSSFFYNCYSQVKFFLFSSQTQEKDNNLLIPKRKLEGQIQSCSIKSSASNI